MTFCSNCGEKVNDGAKFCVSCGAPTDTNRYTDNNKRKTVYEGEVHKCPNCGEILRSFTANCPTCGHELRGTKATSSVRELADKLESIEANRENVKHNPIKTFYFGQALTKADEQKITLIRSFSIPNTKEDLYEFLILSESNINMDLYDEGNQFKKNDARRAVSDAWKAKFEQAYQKAKILFADDPRMTEIQALYDSTHKSINKAKWKTWKFVGIVWGITLVLFAILFAFTFTITSCDKKEEITRLEGIEEKIETALNDGDYKLALTNANRLEYSGYDTSLEKDWEIKRNYWIDKVIEEAAENGVILEKTIDREENDEEQTSTSTSSSNKDTNSNKGETDNYYNTAGQNENVILAEGVTANSNKYLQIKEVGYTMSGDYITCVVTLENLSADKVIEFPVFRVTAYDENDKIIGSEERTLSVIYPNQNFVDGGTLIEVSEKPHRIDVTVLEPEDYNIVSATTMDHPIHKQMIGKNISVNSDNITGEIYNPNDYKIDSAMVTVVFKDANGTIVSSEMEFVDQIPANGTIPFDISLASNEQATDKIEVFAYIW
ncbi:MAG: zinc-ribbon domain-containing protein [Ruminococcus sp.]